MLRFCTGSACPLKAFDEDLVNVILDASKASDISVVTNEEPTRIERNGSGYKIAGKSGAEYEADVIIEATGRVPNLSALNGNHGEVDSSSRGVVVNEYLQSVSNPNVYAIGDCSATQYQLAPVADEEGKVAAHNILHGNSRTMDYSVVPSTVFTIPSLATVGLTEEQAKDQGSTVDWPSSKRIGEAHSGYKILIDEEEDTILGAHIARHNSSEVINIFGLADEVRHPGLPARGIHVGLSNLYLRPEIYGEVAGPLLTLVVPLSGSEVGFGSDEFSRQRQTRAHNNREEYR